MPPRVVHVPLVAVLAYVVIAAGTPSPRTDAALGKSHAALAHDSDVNSFFRCKDPVALSTIPTAWVHDGVCDCCDGSDESDGTCFPVAQDGLESMLLRNCSLERSDSDRMVASAAAYHKRGAGRAVKAVLPHKDASALLQGFARDAQSANSAAQQKISAYTDAARNAAALHAKNRLSQRKAREVEALQASARDAHVRASALATLAQLDFGPRGELLSLTHTRAGDGPRTWPCVSTRALSEKDTRGGSTTSISKAYVYTVCWGANVTQTEHRPDEWQRLSDEAKGLSSPVTVTVDAHAHTHTQDREFGTPTLLGAFRGYLPLHSVQVHMDAGYPHFTSSPVSVSAPPDVTTRLPRATGYSLAPVVAYFEGVDTCLSEGVTAPRRVYVFHICPGLSPSMWATAERARCAHRAAADGPACRGLPPRAETQRWNAEPSEDVRADDAPRVLCVEEDGLCTYKVYLATHFACDREAAAAVDADSRNRRKAA